MRMIELIVRTLSLQIQKLKNLLFNWYYIQYLRRKGVVFNTNKIRFLGPSRITIESQASVKIGENFRFVSGVGNIDNSAYGLIMVKKSALLSIGNNTGMTNTVIQCHKNITIGNNVNIGAGTMIVDTDFHSLDWRDRLEGTDILKKKSSPVVIKDLAFIGARSIILKGVTIGEKSIVGAGSVVTKDIPDGEIWAGNPARFIRKIKE